MMQNNPFKKNTAYYLTEPFVFRKRVEPFHLGSKGQAVLKTLKSAICGSDLQYYLGQKAKEKLKQRLPVIPLHEGVCLNLATGKRVVPVAGDLTQVPKEFKGRENIYPGLPYMGSTADGLARHYLTYPKELLVSVPDNVGDDLACLVEPLSIIFHSLNTVIPQHYHRIAIVGDGTMSYLLAMVLHSYYQLPKPLLTVYGIWDSKLAKFSEFANTINTDTQDVEGQADIIFEAVGGPEMQRTLDVCLKLCAPGSLIGIIGISDSRPSLAVSKLVNWGVTIKGLTRSTYFDYKQSLTYMADYKMQKYLQKFIHPRQFTINSATDLKEAFDFAVETHAPGRILISFPV
ncbi:MAG: dehydrogenase [Candidatus Amesbacteria bacterium GW2011_GWA2_47_11b]|uniref:Dehydrogenase n=3 Tax=Candidatus Amesiibacteriota TaxID=1752730 RepID=A0A0G1VJU4_9BACT|nr:MAG: dehydrogenase [Candidatus Curtissbacteria bacterium GW2011_GWB1_40_28]KKU29409.1 MAG: dehydrogenase [Microgenomates group bacterium GW2011_GWC1_46_20]KKU58511.1 MAG: dehydrogenase [Candidatus Amesbacteria bacterium GW2011_GWA2_47_11b]KKU70350.1 MAG: dehydrogenase [Candidatus Amesbacteria bacterium GW2011_GWA1_47_20]HCH59289.1 hypothetical protein [Candidatus Zambryskibacteria bacterium]